MAKILQICNSGFFLNKFLTPLVEELVLFGHQVVCLTDGEVPLDSCLHGKVEIVQFPFPRSLSPLAFARRTLELRHFINQHRFDIVNSHNRNSSLIARLACFLAKGPRPINLYTARGFYFHDGQNFAKKIVGIGLEALLAPLTDYTLSQSQEDVDLMRRWDFIKHNKIKTIFNGIPTDLFSPRGASDKLKLEEKLGLEHAHFRLSITSRLVPGKGLEDLIAAFVQIAQIGDHLMIIGGNIPQDRGGIGDKIQSQVELFKGPGKIELTGLTDKVPQYLAVSDAFILPSYREGMPRSLIEALSCGLPSAASDIRGCREILNVCDENPILFTPGNISEIAEAITKLKQRSQSGVPNLKLREKAREYFDQSPYVERQVAAINMLLRQSDCYTASE